MTLEIPEPLHPALAGNRAYRLQRGMLARPLVDTGPPASTPAADPGTVAAGPLPEGLAAQFQVEAVLGGEDTRIYRARDRQLGRSVAIRLPRHPEEPRRLRRFEAEARLLVELDGKGAPAVYDYLPVGRVDPQYPFLITEWFDQTLEAVLTHDPLPLPAAVGLLEKLLEAVHAVHRAGVIHRDLKPANVLLSADLQQLKLGDFGIGIRVGESPPSARLSHQYTPPEAYSTNVSLDQRVDIYAIGWIAYELLLGRERFQAEFQDIYNAELELERANRWIGFHTQSSGARPLHEVDERIPRELSDIVARMTARNREQRFDSGEAVLVALAGTGLSARGEPAAGEESAGEPPGGTGAGLRERLRGWPGLAAAAGLALLLGGLVLVLLLGRASPFEAARAATLAARAAAEEVGAQETPEPGFQRGDQLLGEADGLHDDGQQEAAVVRMLAARDAFQAAREAVLGRIAGETREEMRRKREAAAQLGADDGLAVYVEGTRLAALGENAYRAAAYDEAIPHLDGAIDHFDLAIQELLDGMLAQWGPRVDEARRQAETARQLAVDNRASTRETFIQGDQILEEALTLMDIPIFEDALHAFQGASELYVEAAASQARERTESTRQQLERSGFSATTPKYAQGLERAQQAEAQYRQLAYQDAVPIFNDATRLFREVLAEGDHATILFRVGSTAEERDTALALCRQHRQAGEPPCDPAWFTSEHSREVALSPFVLDATEVSNREFAAFAEAKDYQSDAEREGSAIYWNGQQALRVAGFSWRQPRGPGSSYHDRPNHPVTFMSRSDAEAYCAWRGARLPTEEEWELAARGSERRLFPWGNDWQAQHRAGLVGQGTRATSENPASTTPSALHGMAGNVWEWTATTEGGEAILKGGSYLERNPVHLRAASRLRENPAVAQFDYGFRCAEDAERWTLRY